MKICHVQGIFSPEHGGPAKSLENYCQKQVESGHRVSVWTLEGFPNSSAAIRLPPPVEMHVGRVDPPARLGGSSALRRQLREAESPDIYHLHGAWLRAMYYGAIEARRRQRPYVLELMGMYEPWALRQKRWQKWMVRWWFQDRILREAACLHVNSTQEAEYLRKLGFKAPVAVIPVGVDVAKVEMLPGEVACWNKEQIPQAKTDFTGQGPVKYAEDFTGQGKQPGEIASQPGGLIASHSTGQGFHGPTAGEVADRKLHGAREPEIQSKLLRELEGRPFILYLSRIHPKKGLDLLIRAWATVQHTRHSTLDTRHSDWLLVIAGTGAQSYVDECRQLAAQLGIANQCFWAGHVDELQKSWLFTHARCYVLPTSSENFGNVVAEALAHGTPVITTLHTPWTDLPKHRCGWLINNTESEMSQALNEAMRMDAATRKEMGTNGKELVRRCYSLELVCRNIQAVYEWVLGGEAKPECVQTKS
jgi:glycosyltransferase involved in cell wall biosynthesis